MKKKFVILTAVTLLLSACGNTEEQLTPETGGSAKLQQFLKKNAPNQLGVLNVLPMSNVVNTETGELREQGMVFVPKKAINFKGGKITAELNGPDNTNFDLHLYRADGIKWVSVGKSTNEGSKEKIEVDQLKAGKYAFLVLSKQGQGKFDLKINLGDGDGGTDPEKPGEIGKYPPNPYPKLVYPVTDANFAEKMLEKSKSELVILQFSKKGCTPCEQVVKEVMDQKMRDDNDWTWGLCDGTQHPETWKKYGEPWFPTMIALRNGEEVGRHVGYEEGDKQTVIDWIDNLRKGGTDKPAELITEVTVENGKLAAMKKASQKHPVVLEFYNEESKNSKVYKDMERLVKRDQGKWTLGRISSKEVALNEGFIIAEYPSVVSLYKGKMIFRQEGERDTATTEKWVKRLYSVKYPDPLPFNVSEYKFELK